MPYLAMTAAEFCGCGKLPPKIAWMACHFSPYGTGLTNLPLHLPEGSLLIVNDRTPVRGHDKARIFDQLAQAVTALKCSAVLLDFQRCSQEASDIASKLLALPCPVIVSEGYARELDCPVFLPPVPLTKTIREYLSPWQGREIWLEAALDGETVTLTEKGSTFSPLPPWETPDCPHVDGELFCHYRIEAFNDKAVFTLRRTKEDLNKLLADTKKLGVTNAAGLYQELG